MKTMLQYMAWQFIMQLNALILGIISKIKHRKLYELIQVHISGYSFKEHAYF